MTQGGGQAGPTGVYESAVRQLTGHLRANDTIVLSFVSNPHPKIKDIDLRLIFQCSKGIIFLFVIYLLFNYITCQQYKYV